MQHTHVEYHLAFLCLLHDGQSGTASRGQAQENKANSPPGPVDGWYGMLQGFTWESVTGGREGAGRTG